MEKYTEAVCKPHCKKFKPGPERPKCGSYEFIRKNLTLGEIKPIRTNGNDSHENDLKIKELACNQCRFLEGCGFRAGSGANPCGGYLVLEKFLSR